MPPDLKSQIYARLVNIVPDWTQFDYFSTTTASQFHLEELLSRKWNLQIFMTFYITYILR